MLYGEKYNHCSFLTAVPFSSTQISNNPLEQRRKITILRHKSGWQSDMFWYYSSFNQGFHTVTETVAKVNNFSVWLKVT